MQKYGLWIVIVLAVIVGGIVFWQYETLPAAPVAYTNMSEPNISDLSETSAPTCTLTFSPTSAHPAQSYTYTWTSKNADYAYIGVKPPASAEDRLPPNGSRTKVVDGAQTDYEEIFDFGVVGKGGVATCNARFPIMGSTETIYSIPSDIFLAEGVPARTTDNTFAITLERVDSDGNPTVTIVAGGQTYAHVPLKGSYKSFGSFRVESCGSMTGGAEFMVSNVSDTSIIQDGTTCVSRVG